MEYKGFFARIMETDRLIGDQVYGLPPGIALPVYYADAFLNIPSFWCRGPGVFIVPVRPNKGLWFDWCQNSEINTAVIPTVKGCNPITGMQTSGFHLERYDEICPKHGCAFLAERFCPECNYKWPSQSYCTGAPLWWDGWFNPLDGTVRQFFFSDDELRDVASYRIGRENTMPAFGFAFYSPKERRQEIKPISYTFVQNNPNFYHELPKIYYTNSTAICGGLNASYACAAASSYSCSDIKVRETKSEIRLNSVTPDVSIGAGAKIQQKLIADSYSLDSWKDTPDAVMTIYFVFQDQFEEIKAGGMRDLTGLREGILDSIPIG